MSDDEFARRAALWAELKPLLIRGNGHEGAAQWLEHAAKVLRIEGRRQPVNEVFHGTPSPAVLP
jgi:hypothetical protein